MMEMTNESGASPRSRKTVVRRLKMGQTVALTPQDDRMIRLVYDFMAGYVKRSELSRLIDNKKNEVSDAFSALPQRFQNQFRRRGPEGISSGHGPRKDDVKDEFGSDDENEDAMDTMAKRLAGKSGPGAVLTEDDHKLAEYRRLRKELRTLEDRMSIHTTSDPKISAKDLSAILIRFGVTSARKQIEQIIWEVDEDNDGRISFDELQLTFYRNVNDLSATTAGGIYTGGEPNTFFRIVEFLTFDEERKGYVLEDDCMEVLFSRYGSYKLEKELAYIFGENLRARGGEGILHLDRYLRVLTERSGRRAPVVR